MFDYTDGNNRNPLGVYFGFSFFKYPITQFNRNLFILKRLVTFRSWLEIRLETNNKVGKYEKCKDFAKHIDSMLFSPN